MLWYVEGGIGCIDCNGLGKEGRDVLPVIVREERWGVLCVMDWGRRMGCAECNGLWEEG